MAPACCLISVRSKPNQPPPSAEGASPSGTETIPKDSKVTVVFSHTRYAELYMDFLDEKMDEGSELANTSKNGSLVTLRVKIPWRFEEDEFNFANQQDAKAWKRLIPFCEISESPESLKTYDEIQPDRFRDLLGISEEAWNDGWIAASYTSANYTHCSPCSNVTGKPPPREDVMLRALVEEINRNTEKVRKVREKIEKRERRVREKTERRERKEKEKIEKRERKDREKKEREENKKNKGQRIRERWLLLLRNIV